MIKIITCNCNKQVNQMNSFLIIDNRHFYFMNRLKNKKVNKIFVFRSRTKKLLKLKGKLHLIQNLQTGTNSENLRHWNRMQMIQIKSKFNGIRLSLRLIKSRER